MFYHSQHLFYFKNSRITGNDLASKINLSPHTVASAAVRSVVIDLLLPPLFVDLPLGSLVCYVFLCFLSLSHVVSWVSCGT